jgi:hypothetical protein
MRLGGLWFRYVSFGGLWVLFVRIDGDVPLPCLGIVLVYFLSVCKDTHAGSCRNAQLL